MKIIIEANIPFIKGILEPVAQVEYLPSGKITPEAVKDTDALLVRTRTECNEYLLKDSKCKFIGTATIGTDHIDKTFCEKAGISVYSAPGCNAPAVAQYVISSVGHWMQHNRMKAHYINTLTLGVIGVGNVGSIVARWAESLGMKVLLNDPPKKRATGDEKYICIETIKHRADIITFHTPLIKNGIDKTVHLCDNDFIHSTDKKPFIINSARGAVTDNNALINGLRTGKISDIAIDCWENEPDINTILLDKAIIATPHIAGYSLEGKMRATSMILEALKNHFNLDIEIPVIDKPSTGAENITLQRVMESYNPIIDSINLKNFPEKFEYLRNSYGYRKEA